MSRILVYAGSRDIAESINLHMHQENIEVLEAESGAEALTVIQNQQLHLLIMEVPPSGVEEINTLRIIRSISSIPIMIVSMDSSERSIILGLNAGADDYVVMPYQSLELIARIKSQVRRYTQLSSICENLNHIYTVDGLEIDDASRKVTVEGREVRLTPIEYKILRLLVQQRGRVISIEQIYESIWKMRAVGAENTIAVHIRHIREKIEVNPRKPRYLKVIWGTGYKVG